ncbi:MAG: hypothetical protein EBR01_03265 [Proteobacteria bacterium]|nr:hypothetical protein [Pseudomonadota bacterium]
MELSNREMSHFNDSNQFDRRFKEAIKYFKSRSPVVFVSQHYKFWEAHGFVQQSLAKTLTDEGVPVVWFDGADWRRGQSVQYWRSPLLKITQLPALPLRRFSILDSLNSRFQLNALKRSLAKGVKPFLWVQSGLDERVARKLPYIDVFSVFDDPYIHAPDGELSGKSSLIVLQNDFAKNIFSKQHPDKTVVLYPPMDISQTSFSQTNNFRLPEGFPNKVMGYIGSFFSRGFDLVMFEDFMRSLPDWGFLLCGRTDELGLTKISRWTKYKNFLYLPWIPRYQVGAVWQTLSLNLMLYRPDPTSHGAFPVKFLEALYHGVPSVSTAVPKTSSLEKIIPQSSFARELKNLAVQQASRPSEALNNLFDRFEIEMNPKFHLIKVSENIRDK